MRSLSQEPGFVGFTSRYAALRRLERAITHAARRHGISRPDLYAVDPDAWTGNCLEPEALAIFRGLSRHDCPPHLVSTARRMCQSVIQSRKASR